MAPLQLVVTLAGKATTNALLPDGNGLVTDTPVIGIPPLLLRVIVSCDLPLRLAKPGVKARPTDKGLVTVSVTLEALTLEIAWVLVAAPTAIVLIQEPTVLEVTVTLTVQVALEAPVEAGTVRPLTEMPPAPAAPVRV